MHDEPSVDPCQTHTVCYSEKKVELHTFHVIQSEFEIVPIVDVSTGRAVEAEFAIIDVNRQFAAIFCVLASSGEQFGAADVMHFEAALMQIRDVTRCESQFVEFVGLRG